MKKYELVVVINPNISKEDQNEIISSIEKLLPNWYELKDEMWVLKTYNFTIASKNNLALYVSYLLELTGDDIVELKKKFSLMKNLWRSAFFSMNNKVAFVNYADINGKFVDSVKELSVRKTSKSSRDNKKVIVDEKENIEIVTKEDDNVDETDKIDVIPEYEEPKKRIKKK